MASSAECDCLEINLVHHRLISPRQQPHLGVCKNGYFGNYDRVNKQTSEPWAFNVNTSSPSAGGHMNDNGAIVKLGCGGHTACDCAVLTRQQPQTLVIY